MYRVLIVEDEPLELQALHKLLLEYDQFDEIYLASNSEEALACARSKAPDLVLMDINIPGCSGLKVIETLRSENYLGEVIFLTAYSYFEYAQTAVRLRSFDYLLKPVDREELDECLQKAFAKLAAGKNTQDRIEQLRERIQEINSYLQPMVIRALLESGSAEKTLRILYNWPADGELQAFALCFAFEDSLNEDDLKCFYYDFYALCSPWFSIVADTRDSRALFAMQAARPMERTLLELTLWCLVVSALQRLHRDAVSCAVQASPMYEHYTDFADFPHNSGAVFPAEPPLRLLALQKGLRPAVYAQQSKALLRLRSGAPEKAFSCLKSLICEESTQYLGLFCLFSALLECDAQADVLGALLYTQEEGRTPASALNWLREVWSHKKVSDLSTFSTGFVIEQALDAIRTEYGNSMLSQADVATQLGLSQSYFSRLFKKETGETFMAALTHTRLSHAKEMLAQGASIQETSEACGYQSKKYFSDVFRQNFGVSVTQYLRGEEAP